jgi:hypothetical protein
MKKSTSLVTRDQLKSLIRESGVFNKVFSGELFSNFLASEGIEYRNRSLTPDILLWSFINQILDGEHTCRAAVASIIAKFKVEGKKTISTATGAYCQARSKLPESFYKGLAKLLGKTLDQHCGFIQWKGFVVKLVDGSDLSLPVTDKNLEIYSRTSNSTGLLKCRIVGIFSLAHGGLLDLAIGPFSGKGTGEVSMLRNLYDSFKKGELVLMDRLFCTYFEMASLLSKEVDFVIRKNACMKSDFRKGEKLGKNDHIVELKRSWNRCESVHRKLLLLPKKIKVREVKIIFKRKGFKTKELYLLTSLLDSKKYSKEDLIDLFMKRWNVEVDLRSIKTFLKMDILRGKSPEMVSKEIWMHMITYNHIRTVMLDGAILHNVDPREISFKEALILIKAFRPYMAVAKKKKFDDYYLSILEGLLYRVGNRPGRIEPRLVRNNTMRYRLLKKERSETKYGFWKSGWAWEKRKKAQSAVA